MSKPQGSPDSASPGSVGPFVPGRHAAAVAPPPPLPPAERARLDEAFRATLARGIHGMCFSPYLEGQQPGSQVSEAQIRERLEILRPYARWVRSFSCTDGHEHTPRIAHELGLRTLVGGWLGDERDKNEREIDNLIAVARAGHADLVAVGNEVLLRGDLTEDELIAYLSRVREALPPEVPVGYVDAYHLFEAHPRVTAACDVVLANCYPFWECCPRPQAVTYMREMYRRTVAIAHGKPVIISETGWPDRGSAFGGAVPSTEGAMQYFVDTQNWARRDAVAVFYFAAFDEAWKVGDEGDVGAFWGLWDKHGELKFP